MIAWISQRQTPTDSTDFADSRLRGFRRDKRQRRFHRFRDLIFRERRHHRGSFAVGRNRGLAQISQIATSTAVTRRETCHEKPSNSPESCHAGDIGHSRWNELCVNANRSCRRPICEISEPWRCGGQLRGREKSLPEVRPSDLRSGRLP